MPKDPTRNQPNYNISGSHLNEFAFQQNHAAISEEEREHEQQELEAEQESAEAMDAEVQDTLAADETTEGQPT